MALDIEVFGYLTSDAPEANRLVSLYDGAPRYVAVHSVAVDGSGTVTDARLCAWNEPYQTIRSHTVRVGDSMLDEYVDGAAAVDCVRRAWADGLVHQLVRHGQRSEGVYRLSGAQTILDVVWQRVGDHVVEVATEVISGGTDVRPAGLHASGACMRSSQARAAVRQEIAEELHDSVIQQLFASVLRLNVTTTGLDNPKQAESLRQVSSSLSAAISDLRALINGLIAATHSPVRREIEDAVGFVAESSGARCSVEIDDESVIDHTLAPAAGNDILVNLCMAARELVSNAVRHGQAAQIWVRLEKCGPYLVLTVDDDGVGLRGPSHSGNGLGNLQARARRLGGDFELGRRAGGGATARWRAPLPVREDEA